MKRMAFVVLLMGFTRFSIADCEILKSNGSVVRELGDVLFTKLSKETECPQNVFQLKEVLVEDGLSVRPSMVANRGRHNPRLGSFSFFEVATGLSKSMNQEVPIGRFYFGHFTGSQGGIVDLDQAPEPGKLLIELIAWDFKEEVFNFYELIGTQRGGLWFFRGNSKDVFKDNQFLHLQSDPSQPAFGKSMRCSACHTSGGPIMKELEPPHNDWWIRTRPLPISPNQPSQILKKWLDQVEDASKFAWAVKEGQSLLETSVPFQNFKQALSLQEQLRPLFCTTEINLVSSNEPLEADPLELNVPAQFWIAPIFSREETGVSLDKKAYIKAISQLGYRFPETNRLDADHAWLGPVKGHSDFLQIEGLIKKGTVTKEFVSDVLAVDLTNPLFSKVRCDLLRLVPRTFSLTWQSLFSEALIRSKLQGATALLENLTEAAKDQSFHLATAKAYLNEVRKNIPSEEFLLLQLKSLQELREAVFSNEISKNPRGQILEPGFRVIFPVPNF